MIIFYIISHVKTSIAHELSCDWKKSWNWCGTKIIQFYMGKVVAIGNIITRCGYAGIECLNGDNYFFSYFAQKFITIFSLNSILFFFLFLNS